MSENENDSYPVLMMASQIRAELQKELVVVPEWKTKVWVYELTGAEMDSYRQPMFAQGKNGKLAMNLKSSNLRIVVLAARDANGNRLWTDVAEGVRFLGTLPTAGTERLSTVALRLSGMSGTEDAEGNSDATSTDDSASDSPDISSTP